ncbi:HAD family hydrolase [Okeania sp. KiyG1]|uniref:KdsC family phosphatase n=1 Tax=Okeania sp. KiyG1 TaxID=2720165 RepID=UPI0019248058|nr:HAD-IIIA family hydrolase [Okeania sp. KiyG1]
MWWLRKNHWQSLATNLQMLVLDVDGVMTDGGIILLGNTEQMKRFNSQDGLGIKMARTSGLKVAIITGRKSEVVERRARELKIDDVYQGYDDKTLAFTALLQEHNIQASQVAYIGDDLPDVPVMKRVGIPVAVKNARLEVKRYAAYVTKASGGNGAIREAVEWLLELQGKKGSIINGLIQQS